MKPSYMRRMNYRVVVVYPHEDGPRKFEGFGWHKLRSQAENAAEKLECHFPGCVRVINYKAFWAANA